MKDGEVVQVGTGEEILTNPANDYVRDFVEEVDRSKVLTAANIMIPAIATRVENKGPNVILNEIRHEKTSLVMAVNSKRELLGFITADKLLEARRNNISPMDIIDTNVTRVEADTLVEELFPIMNDSSAPIAVVENNRLLGVIRRGTIIDALAKTNGVNN